MSANIYTGGYIGVQVPIPDLIYPSGVFGIGPVGVTSDPYINTTLLSLLQSAKVWLDAADPTTITQVAGAVSQWDNKGTLGDFTQGTGALQPTTNATTQNGFNVLDFAGDYLVSADAASNFKFLTDGTDHLICAVWKPGTTANPNAAYTLIGTNITSTVIGTAVYYDDRASVPYNDKLIHNVTAGSFTFPIANVSADGYMTANTFAATTVFADPNNGTAANRSELYNNAGSATKNNTQTTSPSASNPANTLRIGDGNDAGFTLTGSIAEIVIVSGADATETNRQTIRNYLNAKWAVY